LIFRYIILLAPLLDGWFTDYFAALNMCLKPTGRSAGKTFYFLVDIYHVSKYNEYNKNTV